MEEDKQKICDLLLPVLQATRGLCDLQELEYCWSRGLVYAKFPYTTKIVTVEADSGIAMIKDIITHIV